MEHKDEKLYSLEEIKKAFWEEFDEAGELWFPKHGTDDEDANKEITIYWLEFVDYLKGAS